VIGPSVILLAFRVSPSASITVISESLAIFNLRALETVTESKTSATT